MQSFSGSYILRRCIITTRQSCHQQCRHASLTGAIEKGIRRAQVDRFSRQPQTSEQDDTRNPASRERLPQRGRGKAENFRSSDYRSNEDRLRTTRRNVIVPQAIPYTTAGSQFLYGTSAVDAAIRARRRQLHKLYMYGEEDEHEKDIQMRSQKVGLQKIAMAAGIKIEQVGGPAWKGMLDRMSGSRPHNGVVLEASSVPHLLLESLQPQKSPSEPLRVQLGHHSLEEQNIASKVFDVSGTTASIQPQRSDGSHPFLLLLDRVTDPGNLGSILRSAYYFGVDAVIILEHGSAPFSAVTVKASAGAAEYVPIFRVKDEVKFMQLSRDNGWQFFAAVAPDSISSGSTPSTKVVQPATNSTLKQKPCVLMLGNEGSGIRPRLARLVDGVVTVPGATGRHQGIDSLNVGVAAALLIRDFLAPPQSQAADEMRPNVTEEAVFSYAS